jgi:adenosine deaminase
VNITALPKIELHLHLDCCLSFEVVQKINPSISYEAYRESFIAPAKCTDLADYISRAIKGFELMQTEEELRLVVLDLFDQLQKDHVIYAEMRFAPLQHLDKGLTPQKVVQAVNDAVTAGTAQTGIQAGIILCTLRHYTAEQSMETVRLVKQFTGTHVAGFDIAADEAGFPVTNHIAAFQFAHENGIHCTAHAGEAKGAESVWETLQHFHPERIGHGVRSVEDPALIECIRQKNIHLELCPTSNVQTNVYPAIKDHPADVLYRSGVSMSINTDARTISDVTLASEYSLLENTFNWKKEHFLRCNLEAIRHSFTTAAAKKILEEKLVAGFNIDQ